MLADRVDVLAVDDNPNNLLSLEAVLQDLGANLVKAHSGDEALLRVLERDFALVLLDIHMPGLDGFETARLIRGRDRSRHLPVIFLTAFDHDSEQVQHGYALGAVDFLFKPIVPTILKSKVSVFLDLHRKTTEVVRQAELLQEASRREHARTLAAARTSWEREQLQANNERLEALATVANLLLSETDPAVFVPAACEELATRLGLEAGAVHLAAHDEEGLSLAWRYGLESLPGGDTLLIRAVRERSAPVVLQRIEESDDPLAEVSRLQGIRAAVCLPLIAEQRFTGVLGIGTRSRDAISEDELAVLRVAADQLAIALDRVHLVRELERHAGELRAADRRKDEFLAMLAHELRNPLAPVVNTLALARRRTPEDDPALRSFVAAERQALHMARLLEDLLDVSRITKDKIALRREQVDLQEAIEHALETAAPLVEVKRHRLVLSLPAAPTTVDADATRLTQIVANLLHNAAKYTDEGGNIWLACTVDGSDLVVLVEDDGVGIEAGMLEQIFDTFAQIDPSSDRARGGLGLGLTLVRRLVEQHGGSVSAWSEGAGRGSRFEVRMPIVIAASAERLQAAAAPVDPMRSVPRRVLLVEDNDDIRITLRDLLEFEGHEVSEASDGSAGAALIVENRPNLALVDIGLPGLDGYQVAELVRRDLAGRDTRLVALTGYGGDDVARKAREAGFDAHLVKPVKIDELFRLIGQLC